MGSITIVQAARNSSSPTTQVVHPVCFSLTTLLEQGKVGSHGSSRNRLLRCVKVDLQPLTCSLVTTRVDSLARVMSVDMARMARWFMRLYGAAIVVLIRRTS